MCASNGCLSILPTLGLSSAPCLSFLSCCPAPFTCSKVTELKNHLEGVLVRHAHYPVVIVSGDKYLEVRIRGVNKGELVYNVVRQVRDSAPRLPLRCKAKASQAKRKQAEPSASGQVSPGTFKREFGPL